MTIARITYRSPPPSRQRVLDWDDLRQRLEQSRQSLTTGEELATERFRLLLAERTERLAAPLPDNRVSRWTPMLVCRNASEDYALPLDAVASVAPLGNLTMPPRAPPALLGAMNLHGVIHRIFGFRRIIGSGGDAETEGHVLVLRHSAYPTGLRVDRAKRIVEIDADRLTSGRSGDRSTHWTLGSIDGIQLLDLEAITDYLANFDR
ncbi:hypothetical protein CCP3SC15_20025 [Gammaproteobacteria bacterium]